MTHEAETTDRYVKLVVQLTRLTVQGVVEWTRRSVPTHGILEAEVFSAEHNGRRFELMSRALFTRSGLGTGMLERTVSAFYPHVLVSTAQDGGDQVIFPPSQAIENLASLLKAQNARRGLDDLERALGIA